MFVIEVIMAGAFVLFQFNPQIATYSMSYIQTAVISISIFALIMVSLFMALIKTPTWQKYDRHGFRSRVLAFLMMVPFLFAYIGILEIPQNIGFAVMSLKITTLLTFVLVILILFYYVIFVHPAK